MNIKGKVHCFFEQSGTSLSNLAYQPKIMTYKITLGRPTTRRGDYFTKPTSYWFVNCQPTHGKSMQQAKEHKTVMTAKGASHAGLCSEERSMISPDYARNFICDFIIGKEQIYTLRTLF